MVGRDAADVLVFAEDPGAANFLADLPRVLWERGHATQFFTDGIATTYLGQRGVPSVALPAVFDCDGLLAAARPKLLVVGTAENPDSAGLRLTAAAKRKGIPSLGALDAGTNLAFRFRGRSKDALAYCPDMVVAPDAASRDALQGIGLPAQRIVVTGHPHWDHVRAVHASLRARPPAAVSDGRMTVLFAAELSDGLDPAQYRHSAEYTLQGEGKSSGRTEIVLEEFLAAAKPLRAGLHLVLRLHPKQPASSLAAYRHHFDALSQAESSLEAIHASNAVVGMTSMLLAEAALLQRPTLAILPRAKEAAWLPTIAAGITPCALDREAVRREVARLPQRQPADAAALDALFPVGALGRMAAACERVGLLSNDGTRPDPAA